MWGLSQALGRNGSESARKADDISTATTKSLRRNAAKTQASRYSSNCCEKGGSTEETTKTEATETEQQREFTAVATTPIQEEEKTSEERSSAKEPGKSSDAISEGIASFDSSEGSCTIPGPTELRTTTDSGVEFIPIPGYGRLRIVTNGPVTVDWFGGS